MINHILIELFCRRNYNANSPIEIPSFCESDDCSPKYECLLNKCPYLDFTSHENALCYINEDSETEEIITLGGDMLLDESNDCEKERLLWKQICLQKIEEAYQMYMEKIEEMKK